MHRPSPLDRPTECAPIEGGEGGEGGEAHRTARWAALLTLVLAACEAREESGAEEYWQRPGAPAPSHVWAGSSEGRALRAFAWGRPSGLDGAGRPAIPVAPRTSDLELAFGAAGRTPAAVAYLPLDEEEGTAARDHAGDERPVIASGTRAAAGRFGGGLELLGTGSSLRIGGEEGLPLVEPWTVSFWIRPRVRRSGGILRLPGLLSLRADHAGRLSVRLDAEPELDLSSESTLSFAHWNHVAVVWEGPRPPQLRLVLNERVVGCLRRAESSAPARVAAVLGSSEEGEDALPAIYDDVLVERRAASSAEALERFAAHAEPGEHELSLELAGGERRTVTVWAGILKTAELRTREDWSSGALRHFAVDEGGLRRVAGHWERDPAPSPPPARTTHPTVYVGDHRVFVFGGEVKDSHLFPMVNRDDTWIYHARRRRWQRVAPAPAPEPRCHQPAAYSPDHGVVLLCGGWRNDDLGGFTYADTWVYHVDEMRWERRSPSGPALPASSHASLVYHGGAKRFLLFIGTRVWEYDPEGDAWRKRPEAPVVREDGRPAEYRPGGSRMAGYDPETGLVVLFGSERWTEGELVYGDPTVVYDRDADRFVVREPAVSPSPRARSGFARDARRGWFVLYGGVCDERSKRFDDLWTYRVATNEWRRWSASGAPSRRGGYYGMAYDPDDDVFLLLAGRHSVPRFLDEAWRLHLDPEAVAEAAYVFDRAGLAAADRVVLDWEGPEGSDVRVTVQGSADANAWRETSEPVDGADRFVRVRVTARSAGDGEVRISGLRLFAGARPARGVRRIELPIAPLR